MPGVVFPTAAVDRGETLMLYYGAADTCTAAVEISWKEIVGGDGVTWHEFDSTL